MWANTPIFGKFFGRFLPLVPRIPATASGLALCSLDIENALGAAQGGATQRANLQELTSMATLDYLSGKTDKSPRGEFIYVNDAGEVVAILEGCLPRESGASARCVAGAPLSHCACHCSSTYAAIHSRETSKTRTPTTTGLSTGRMCSRRCRLWLAGFSSPSRNTSQPDARRLEPENARGTDQGYDHRRAVIHPPNDRWPSGRSIAFVSNF